ncbi:MAG: hypothetical protein JNM20_06085 [Rhizobiales bacterium]|nr:hypothetical protein [Hyphomicrobiales bacterium]
MGSKIGKNKSLKEIGEAIVIAWENAAANGGEIDRKQLLSTLTGLLKPDAKNGRKRKVEFDLVFDNDIDDDTRMVWLAIPTPDPKLVNGVEETWQTYIDREFGAVGARKTKQLEDLADAVLFGCGR